MNENCENCPVNARVDSLVKEFDRYRDGSGKTHKEMFERLSALEQARASMETMLESMDGKLDKTGQLAGDAGRQAQQTAGQAEGELHLAGAGRRDRRSSGEAGAVSGLLDRVRAVCKEASGPCGF